MKYLSILFLTALFITSCDKSDDVIEGVDYSYHAHVKSPKGETLQMGDTLELNVLFESHSGEPVHNVKVEIASQADPSNVVFDYHDHVHATESSFNYVEHLVINEANGFSASNTYVFTASVWGTEGDDDGLESEETTFSIE